MYSWRGTCCPPPPPPRLVPGARISSSGSPQDFSHSQAVWWKIGRSWFAVCNHFLTLTVLGWILLVAFVEQDHPCQLLQRRGQDHQDHPIALAVFPLPRPSPRSFQPRTQVGPSLKAPSESKIQTQKGSSKSELCRVGWLRPVHATQWIFHFKTEGWGGAGAWSLAKSSTFFFLTQHVMPGVTTGGNELLIHWVSPYAWVWIPSSSPFVVKCHHSW